MGVFSNLFNKGISEFFKYFFEDLISLFASILADIMGSSIDVLKEMPLIHNGTHYAKVLALTILVIKTMNEAFQTYILYQNGDPDADPTGLLIRTSQAVAIITTLPWIVQEIFTFGSKVAHDVAGLGTGQTGIDDWGAISLTFIGSGGAVGAIFLIILVIMFLVVAFQATIRGAELGLMSILGPIMALNITANNRNMWSAWFKQIIITCTSQAIQIFMLQGAFGILTNEAGDTFTIFKALGWLWVTIKTPKYIQQFAYSTGFTGALGGTVKSFGNMYLSRKMLRR